MATRPAAHRHPAARRHHPSLWSLRTDVLIIGVFILTVAAAAVILTVRDTGTASSRVTVSPLPLTQLAETAAAQHPSAAGPAVPDDSVIRETQTVLVDTAQWMRLKSMKAGISFEYPVPAASRIYFGYVDMGLRTTAPTGQSFGWSLTAMPSASASGNHTGTARPYPIAGGVSERYRSGQQRAITDFHTLTPGDYGYTARIIKTRYGTDAVFRPSPDTPVSPGDASGDAGVVILADLPFPADSPFSGIAIYVKDGLTLAEAKRIVSSISLE